MATEVTADPRNQRVPPADVVAEQAVLGSVLIKPSSLVEVRDILETDDFFQPAHREIFDAMKRVEDRGRAVDVVALADELLAMGMIGRLEGGEMYLLRLYDNIPTAENVVHYANIVREKAVGRRIIALCNEAAARAYGLVSPDEIMADLVVDLTGLETKSDDVPNRLGDDIEDKLRVIDLKSSPETRHKFFVPTGIRKFDRMTGGYGMERLHIVAAPPGGGKTAWAVNVARYSALARAIPNLYVSLEMPEQEVFERVLGAEGGVEIRNIHRGNLTTSDWKEDKLLGAVKRIGPAPFWVYDRPSDIGKICAVARRWAAMVRRSMPPPTDGLPALVHVTVDYIQIVDREERRGRSEADALGLISRSLKSLAKQLKCPVSALSQYTLEELRKREIDGKRPEPRPENLKGSGSLLADADMVILLHHEERDDQDHGAAPDAPSHVDIIVGKNRGGPTGKVGATWDRRTMTFRDEQVEFERDSRLPDDDRDF